MRAAVEEQQTRPPLARFQARRQEELAMNAQAVGGVEDHRLGLD